MKNGILIFVLLFSFSLLTQCVDISNKTCTSNVNCSDGLHCNGIETCNRIKGLCSRSQLPCDPLYFDCDEQTNKCIRKNDTSGLSIESTTRKTTREIKSTNTKIRINNNKKEKSNKVNSNKVNVNSITTKEVNVKEPEDQLLITFVEDSPTTSTGILVFVIGGGIFVVIAVILAVYVVYSSKTLF